MNQVYVDPTIVEAEVSQLAMQYSLGDRTELARDLKRLRESDRPIDRAILESWKTFLRDTRAAEEAIEQKRGADEQRATAERNAAIAEKNRLSAMRDRATHADPVLGILYSLVRLFEAVPGPFGPAFRENVLDDVRRKIDVIAADRAAETGGIGR